MTNMRKTMSIRVMHITTSEPVSKKSLGIIESSLREKGVFVRKFLINENPSLSELNSFKYLKKPTEDSVFFICSFFATAPFVCDSFFSEFFFYEKSEDCHYKKLAKEFAEQKTIVRLLDY